MTTALKKSIHNDFKKMCENNYKLSRQNYMNSKKSFILSKCNKDNNKCIRISYLCAKIFLFLLQHDKLNYKKCYNEIKQLCYDVIDEGVEDKTLINFKDNTIQKGDCAYLKCCNHYKEMYDNNEKLNNCVNNIPNWF